MTLYLKIAVGPTAYLVAAAEVTDLQPASAGATDGAIDLRALFGAPPAGAGFRMSFAADATGASDLVVDRLDGLVEIAEERFRALPAIGRFGALIDAVAVPGADEAPALRLRLGPALRVLAEAR